MSETDLSRRAALGCISMAALATTAILPDAALSADTELLALEPLIREAYKKYGIALDRISQAQKAFFKECPKRPVFDNDLYRGLKGDDKRAYFEAWGPLIQDYEEQEEQLKERFNIEELRAECDPLEDAFDDLIYQLTTIPAKTMAGLRLKAEMAEHSDSVGQSLIEDILAMEVNDV